MNMQEKDRGFENVSDVDIRPQSEELVVEELPHSQTIHMKHNSKGILLVPQPSDDPRDPLVSLNSELQKSYLLTPIPELVSYQEGHHTCNRLPLRLLCLIVVSCQYLWLSHPSTPV